MKKIIKLGLIAVLTVVVFSSCKKLMCQCVATGYVPQDRIEEVLNRHIGNCVSIAETSGSIVDDGVTVTCSY